MKIDIIDRMEDFQNVRDDWHRIYMSDPSAQVYLSWEWMAQWLPLLKNQWLILAAKENSNSSNYVAFFPLRARTHMSSQGGFFTELAMAGNRFADYTGFICDSNHRRNAIIAFGKHISAMKWALINLESVRASEKDLKRLFRCFPSGKFSIEPSSMIDAESGIDNSICPYVDLPDSWDEYLAGLSSNTRQKIRRNLRKVESDSALEIVFSTEATIERDIEALLRMWMQKWSELKGEKASAIANNLRVMLKRMFDSGCLWLPVFYRDGSVVGAHGVVVDRDKKVLNFLVGSRDSDFSNPQPGMTLHARTIQEAIELGYTRYDFLRGNEPYKYSFGCVERRISTTIVKRKKNNARRNVLDKHSLNEMLGRVKQLHAAGKTREAEIGYRQILDLDELCAPALYGFGSLKIAQGEPAVAERAFRTLVGVSKKSDKAWLALANALAAQHRWSEAEKAREHAFNLTRPAQAFMLH